MKRFVVLDVGKTISKLTLWQQGGKLIKRCTKNNTSLQTEHYPALDVKSTEEWILTTLKEFSQLGDINAIIPVSHGAAAAIVSDGKLALPPMDYETKMPSDIQISYQQERATFSETGSPLLPDGLNLGIQLYRLEALYPDIFKSPAQIMPLAQYWAWVLSGVSASEVTSIGCHSDLWQPNLNEPSSLAKNKGWDKLLAPVHHAGDILGVVRESIAKTTGLNPDVKVYCGLHDSNAALLAARKSLEIADSEATIVSTGTWFIAMRSPSEPIDISKIKEQRDCLVNIDINGLSIPSARFMGGREIVTLIENEDRIDRPEDQPVVLNAINEVLSLKSMILPSFSPGFGPFASASGKWVNKPENPDAVRAAIALYAAMVTNVSLNLISSHSNILIEGRFSKADAFGKILAALRPNDNIYVGNDSHDVSYGALSLMDETLPVPDKLTKPTPVKENIEDYHQSWIREISKVTG
ncbi:MAG: carbohydrate kinase [Kordiimonadaceae bacterium]|nr:carbohydrate kinase [Kordiimonadaceae bacterium]